MIILLWCGHLELTKYLQFQITKLFSCELEILSLLTGEDTQVRVIADDNLGTKNTLYIAHC